MNIADFVQASDDLDLLKARLRRTLKTLDRLSDQCNDYLIEEADSAGFEAYEESVQDGFKALGDDLRQLIQSAAKAKSLVKPDPNFELINLHWCIQLRQGEHHYHYRLSCKEDAKLVETDEHGIVLSATENGCLPIDGTISPREVAAEICYQFNAENRIHHMQEQP